MVRLDQESLKIDYPKRVIEVVPFCNQLEVLEKISLNDTLGTNNYNNSPPKHYRQNTYAAAVATAAAIQQQNLAFQHQVQQQSQINNQRSTNSEGSVAYNKKEGNNYNSHLYQQSYRNHQDHQSLQNRSALQNFQKHKNSPYLQPSSEGTFGLNNLYPNLGNPLNSQLFTDSPLSSNRPIDLKNNRLLFSNGTKSIESPVYMDISLGQDQYQLNNKIYEKSNMRTGSNTSPKKLLVSTSDIGIVPQSNTSFGTPTSTTVTNFLDSSSLMPQVGSFGNWNTTSSIWGSPSSVAFSAGSSINRENNISNNYGRSSNMW